MGRRFGTGTLVAICGALGILLCALAVVQYRWSARVAAADAQREKEHLESAAALFANEFNNTLARLVDFLQSDARSALDSGQRIATLPKTVAELYYLDISEKSGPQAQRLTAGGVFERSAVPGWLTTSRCTELVLESPPALMSPLYETVATERRDAEGNHLLRTFRFRPDRCFVARLDEAYLRQTLIPELIRRSFGETSAKEYDFAVVSRKEPRQTIYGAAVTSPDLKRTFFSILPLPPARLRGQAAPALEPGHAVFVQRVESAIVYKSSGGANEIFGPGIWELDIAHKGMPLAAAFEQTRRRDLMTSAGVEVLLLTAIVVLVIAARRMQKLADQKMQFIAGVSHELRTPVSAIAMLARNQADGLVSGTEKVKQYGELIHQQSRRLNEMVEQTLQYAGIHSGLRRPVKNEVDAGRLIEECIDARREELARRGFEVEVELEPDLPRVVGDAALLRTAFENLLTNAQQYAEGGHWIRVRAEYIAGEKEVRISVEDRGAGIDPGDQAEIFEPFCRGRAAVEAQIPGSGLGLSLVRSAVEAHRGSVTLVSEPGRGSTFTLHLPV